MNEGKSVVVIDKPDLSNCSKVAGGIYNPIVFKRLTQSWMADMVLPVMLDFYEGLEEKFQSQLLHPVKIARVFSNEEEENLWQKKSLNELNEFIDSEIYSSENEYSFLKDSYAFVKQAGYVDVLKFLELTRNFLELRNSCVNEHFDYSLLHFEGENVVYNNISGSKIIFCEGHLYHKNPWFKHLKFKPAKGEMLTIFCEELKANSIINKEIFILPLPQKNHFKVGATYDWEDLTDETSKEAKSFLEEKLKKIIPYKYKVLKHEAGVRPSTTDRRPVMGFHLENRNLGIFNGFGTKAIMLAPYFAKHFCSFMENKTALWQEVDVKRFYPAEVK
jgi:glycine oxidase